VAEAAKLSIVTLGTLEQLAQVPLLQHPWLQACAASQPVLAQTFVTHARKAAQSSSLVQPLPVVPVGPVSPVALLASDGPDTPCRSSAHSPSRHEKWAWQSAVVLHFCADELIGWVVMQPCANRTSQASLYTDRCSLTRGGGGKSNSGREPADT
jgi:hypothetical protein